MRGPIDFNDVTRGVHLGVPASAIRGNELAWALNFRPQAGSRIRMRGGYRDLGQATSELWGFYPTVRGADWCGVGFGATTVGRFDPSYAWTDIGSVGSGVREPWSICGWPAGGIFAARPADGIKVVYLNPDLAASAGIAAPSFTLVAADGGAGQLTAANYGYVAAYRDSRTASVGNYAALSNTLALGASRQVTLTGFAPSADPKVDEIVIYRTFPDGDGAWYRVAIVPHTTVSYTDNLPVSGQREAASLLNQVPGPNVRSICHWRARLWTTNGTIVLPSNLLNPQAFDISLAIRPGDTATDPIMQLLPDDSRLVIVKRYSMWYLTGTGATSWEVNPFDEEHGAVSSHSAFFLSKTLYWISDDAPRQSSGLSPSTPVGEGDERLAPVFETLDPAQKSLAVAGPMPGSQGALFWIPSTKADLQTLQFFYSEQTKSWWPWRIRGSEDGVLNPIEMAQLHFIAHGDGPDDQPAVWTGLGPRLTTVDDFTQFGDQILIFDAVLGDVLITQVPELEIAPKFLDFEPKKGQIAALNAKWRGEVVVGEVSPSTAVAGQARLYVYRERRANLSTPEVQLLQTAKRVTLIPTMTALTPDTQEEWQRYTLKTVDGVPASTAGVLVRFVTAEEAAGDVPITRPVSIEALRLEATADTLARKIV